MKKLHFISSQAKHFDASVVRKMELRSNTRERIAIASNYTTGEMREIVDFASRVNAPNVTEAEKQWLVLFARHFVDILEGEPVQPMVLL